MKRLFIAVVMMIALTLTACGGDINSEKYEAQINTAMLHILNNKDNLQEQKRV